jgi:hypothetical protein
VQAISVPSLAIINPTPFNLTGNRPYVSAYAGVFDTR